jgi:hypothetical protein
VTGLTHERGFQGATNVWLTPPHILKALGPFDLDPCAAPEPRPWPTAARHYNEAKDGLSSPWDGFCWVNPPYGPHTGAWLARTAEHGHGIALTFARTETRYFFEHAWGKAGGLFFLKGRVRFCRPDGAAGATAPAPSVLLGYGDEALRRLATSPLQGHLVVAAAAMLSREDGTPCATWREAVSDAMGGRKLRLRDLYRAAEGTAKVREAKENGHNWRAQIRRTLQEHFTPAARGVWRTA